MRRPGAKSSLTHYLDLGLMSRRFVWAPILVGDVEWGVWECETGPVASSVDFDGGTSQKSIFYTTNAQPTSEPSAKLALNHMLELILED